MVSGWLLGAWLLASTPDALAFYNPQTGRWLSRDPIEEGGGPGLNVLLRNDALNKSDVLGLHEVTVKKCTIDIFVGHVRQKEPHVPTKVKNEKCSAASVVGCESVIVPVEAPIPGIQARPDEEINLLRADQIANDDFVKAREHAKALCAACKKECKQIVITIKCAGLGWWEKQAMPGGTCGKTEKVPCCSGPGEK